MTVQLIDMIKASAASLTDRFAHLGKSDEMDAAPRVIIRDTARENAAGRKEMDSLRSALYPQEAA